MTKITGKCLCGEINYSADTDIKMMANCHCTDCRAATGAVYGTLLFIDENTLKVNGAPEIFHHKADSGAKMEKHFCPNCGSQLFGKNSNRTGLVSVRAGGLHQVDLVQPTINVYLKSRIASTPVDEKLTNFNKMPN